MSTTKILFSESNHSLATLKQLIEDSLVVNEQIDLVNLDTPRIKKDIETLLKKVITKINVLEK